MKSCKALLTWGKTVVVRKIVDYCGNDKKSWNVSPAFWNLGGFVDLCIVYNFVFLCKKLILNILKKKKRNNDVKKSLKCGVLRQTISPKDVSTLSLIDVFNWSSNISSVSAPSIKELLIKPQIYRDPCIGKTKHQYYIDACLENVLVANI